MAQRQAFLDDQPDQQDDYLDLTGGLPLPSSPTTPAPGQNTGPSQQTPNVMPTIDALDDTQTQNPPDIGAPSAPPGVTLPPTTTTPGTGTPPGTTTGKTAPTWPTSARPSEYDLLQSLMTRLNASGQTESPEQLMNEFNNAYGSSWAWYGPGQHDSGTLSYIGAPGGYLTNDGPNGAWTYHPRSAEGGNTGTNNYGGTDFTRVGDITQFGQDPFSKLITQGYADLIKNSGMTPQQQAVFESLAHIISEAGKTPADDEITRAQMESARDAEAMAERGQMADATGFLASHGLVGEPGVPQGEEASAVNRVQQNIAPTYAGAVRDAQTAAMQRQNDRLTSSLQTITGLSNAGASQLLQALGEGTQRQIGLANIALNELSLNMQWNQFLAQFGLNRDLLLNQVAQGNSQSLAALIALFLQQAGISTGGHV